MTTNWSTLVRSSNDTLGATLTRLAAAAARAHRARAAAQAAVQQALTTDLHQSLREDDRRVHGRDPQPATRRAPAAPAHTEVGP